MLRLDCVASSITWARLLAASCAVACCVLSLEDAHAQQPPDPTLEPLIKQLHQPLLSGRVHAATKLARLGKRASPATDHLIECLSDTDSDLRLAAAYALGCVQQNSVRVLPALVPVLADEDEHVRYSAQWSIARIASQLGDERSAEQRHNLVSTLETALSHFQLHGHQARHRVTIELALARLRESAPEDRPLAAAKATPPVSDGLALARHIYAANDLLSRLQFVELLSDIEKHPDHLRRAVIAFECEQETPVLFYAVSRWGAHGQQLVTEEFHRLSRNEPLETSAAAIVALLKPASEEQIERLLELVRNRNEHPAIRESALTTLSAATDFSPQCFDTLIDILADADLEDVYRVSAADILASKGGTIADAATRLVDLLQEEHDPTLRDPIAHALARTSAESPAAARAVCEVLRVAANNGHNELYDYGHMLECCGQFGPLAAECLPEFVAALSHEDEEVRFCSAQALQQIGTSASGASATLVARILEADETVRVKSAAARALRAIAPAEGGEQLVRGLEDHASIVCEHTLRALACLGPPAAKFARDKCVAILNNAAALTSVRSAAAAALGAMGDTSSVPKLLEWTASEHPEMLRAASLLAAAQLDPNAALAHIERCRQAQSILLRASTACALRLVGQARAGFDMLVGMLNGSDTDVVIERALAEFGPEVEPWCLEVASDADAALYARLGCLRVAVQSETPAWESLLQLIDDEALADEIANVIGPRILEEPHTISWLLARLQDDDLQPATHARIVRLFQLDGFGAGEEDEQEQWPVALALQQPAAVEALLAAGEAQMPMAEAAAPPLTAPSLPSVVSVPSVPSLPTGTLPPSAAYPPSAEPIGGSYSGGARSSQVRPIKPAGTARATGAPPKVSAVTVMPQVVEVFYGTNRERIVTEAPAHELATGLLATAAGGLMAMLVCLIGFVRSGHRGSAIVSLIAIGAVAPFGFHAARSYSRSTSQSMVAYSGQYRPEIELGVCEVSIPPGHMPGELESPKLLKLEVKPDVAKHIVVTSVEQLSKEHFYDQLHSRMEADGKNLLVFIHGYNVSFEDAARRTAQMAADLKFPGAPVFYSWPSQANWYGYKTDKENIELSVTQIKAFLLDLAAQSGATTINLVAHSMGNVGLTQALKEMEGISPQPLFNQVVLAAPDIDSDIFKHRVAPHIISKAQHITLYTSQTDLALVASRYFNRGARVGDSGSSVLLFPGIDTIDATSVDSSLLGHSYYGSNVSVLTDLGYVLQNQPITQRQYLRTIVDAAQPYWAFDPVRISQSASGESRR